MLAVVVGSCAIDARWSESKRNLFHVSRCSRRVLVLRTIRVDEGKDIEVVVIEEGLGYVIAGFVPMDQLLSNVFNCASSC
jgi:hypothetical protein